MTVMLFEIFPVPNTGYHSRVYPTQSTGTATPMGTDTDADADPSTDTIKAK